MSRFACAFSLVRTVMRRAAPPAALGLIATNRYRPVQPCPRQGAPPPAPHAPRRAHAHLPCPSRAPPRAILCPIASQLTACVCPESCRSRRELSNEVLYVYWGRVFCLEMRSKSQNFLPGLRPGPRSFGGMARVSEGKVRAPTTEWSAEPSWWPSAHRRPGYPLAGCSPAEPASVSPGLVRAFPVSVSHASKGWRETGSGNGWVTRSSRSRARSARRPRQRRVRAAGRRGSQSASDTAPAARGW